MKQSNATMSTVTPSTPAPSSPGMTGSHRAGSKGSAGTSYVGAQNLSSKEPAQRAEQAGGMVSAQTTQAVGNGNVKRSGLITPGSEKMDPLMGGRGMGGY